ncbi:iron complex outermembrane receptor protein [Xanthomonas sacchari]|uniref:TonB-dependent receptor n=1 Tax=Xanthomonas sacchari TaxID=56458 RepID=UPI0020C43466|nr:TonB-dependent receptor [Xanthomonas sacchari]MDQ1094510.1 iron complex outermembrane receptor protein [Xanthomonas sacchari]
MSPHPLSTALALSLLGSCALPAAHAQTVVDLDRVSVSASTSRMPESAAALPNTITVIDQAQLRQQLALTQDLSQVLANLIPSFSPSRQKLTTSGETLRGRKPLYLIDGIPQSTPLREGGRDGHTIDPAMIERIEVIHGANALQGLGASGGIINIITKRAPRQDGQSFQDIAVAGSSALPHRSDSTGERASYLFGTRQGAFDAVAGVSYAREGLYYDGNGQAVGVQDIQGDLMDASSHDLFAKLGWNLDPQRRLQLNANRYTLQGDNDYLTVPGDIASGRPATSRRGEKITEAPRNRSTSVSLDYTDNALAGGYLQAQAYWVDFAGRYGGTTFANLLNDGRSVLDQSQNTSRKVGAKTSWSRGDLFGLPLRATLGLDLASDRTYQELVRSGLKWVPATTYRSLSPFVQAEYRLAPQWTLSAGLRYERGTLEVNDFTTIPSNNGGQFVRGGKPTTTETLPNVGLVWDATEALKLYASYSEGYTVADIGRVLRSINVPNQRVDTLVDLRPVISDNREIGADYEDGRWLIHAAYYWSDAKRGTRLDYDPATQSYRVARERTEIQGFEGTATWQAAEGTRLGVGYATADARYDSNGDGRVDSDMPGASVSPDRVTAFWQQQWTPGISTRLQGSRAVSRRFDLRGTQVAQFDGYTTFDLQTSIALPRGQLSVGVENLFDRQYLSYYAQTTPRNDTYTAGRGRVLTVGWNVRF